MDMLRVQHGSTGSPGLHDPVHQEFLRLALGRTDSQGCEDQCTAALQAADSACALGEISMRHNL